MLTIEDLEFLRDLVQPLGERGMADFENCVVAEDVCNSLEVLIRIARAEKDKGRHEIRIQLTKPYISAGPFDETRRLKCPSFP